MANETIVFSEDALCCELGSAVLGQLGCPERVLPPAGGAARFKDNISRMNNVANNGFTVLMLADADQAACAPLQLASWTPRGVHANLLLRLAVRESESWIMADRHAFAEFAQVSVAVVPRVPDELPDPKQSLLGLIRRCKRRDLRDEMLPARGSRSKVGLGYNVQLHRFVCEQWSAERALANSPSLARTVGRIRDAIAGRRAT